MSNSLDTQALTKAAGIGAGVGAILGLGALVPCFGIVCCGLALLLGAGAGVGYGYFARQNNTSVDAGMGALGGGIAGLASGLGYSILNGIGKALFGLLGIGLGASTAAYEDYGLPPEVASQLAISAGAGIVGILVGACIVLVITGFLGAISGLIYALATDNQPTPPPLAPAM